MKKTGFTLAEVLITLGIIGVVAALTMPSLIAKHKEKVIVTKLKKFYSVMSNAYLMASNEYGDPTNWDLIANANQKGAKNMAEKFKPYLKVVEEENLNSKSKDGYLYVLADGSIIFFAVRDPNCNAKRGSGRLAESCGIVEILLKDMLRKNADLRETGKDSFQLNLTKTGIIPSGLPEDTANPYSLCKPGMTGNQGLGCTAWVIYNENMDYLRCNGLSWTGKTKCN